MENMSNEIKMKINLFSDQENKIGKVLICFSVYTNTKEIFNTKLDTGAIPAIHGLKFLSMCVIIILHAIYFTLDSFGEQFRIYV